MDDRKNHFMKTPFTRLTAGWLLAGLLSVLSAEAPASRAATPEQDTAKLGEQWHKALTDAERDFQSTNDRDSAEFVRKMLVSLDQPGGMAPAALAAHGEQLKARTRELVRQGALESAAALNWAQWQVLHLSNKTADGPIHRKRLGGSPGPDGLVLYLPFDAPPANGVVCDESGAGNLGRVEGAQWVPEGRFGGAYRFHITNVTDRIVIPDNDALNVPYLTVAAWIKTAGTGGFWGRIVDKDFCKGYCLELGGGLNGKGRRGRPGFELKDTVPFGDRPVSDDRWHHIAGTCDGSVSKLYVDGVEVKQVKSKSPGPVPANNWDVCVGNSVVEYDGGEFVAFDGLIDEVRIYNRALSAKEIKALASAQQAGAAIGPAGSDTPSKAPATDRLKQVKELYDKGLISKEDYDKKVKEIIDSL